MSPVFILKAFSEGADGVLVAGCHPGDCHYVSGNYGAEKRVNLVNDLLPELGLERERLMLRWISASEGELFSKTVNEFVDTVKKLGPSPLRKK
jgi:coenzyme F420-reducing hydrogenase delta subunit